jgi:formamidopyrimidine-DNA glycosylase
MPELPDLEVIRRFLDPRLAGVAIASVQVTRPLIVRNLLGGDLAAHLVGRRFCGAGRRGKFLLLPLDGGLTLAINPMLAGRLRYGEPLPRNRARDALVLGLADGHELRYHDAAGMGKVYVTDGLERIPGFSGQGPEANARDLTLYAFRERLRGRHGEIKGILTDASFVAGIGNAYSDEICWKAEVYPFRRRGSLTDDEVARLHSAMRDVMAEAITTLEQRVGDAIDVKIRDFLRVHGKAGQPCPRCGSPISQVTRQRRATCFCRTCQPGLMVGGRDRRL